MPWLVTADIDNNGKLDAIISDEGLSGSAELAWYKLTDFASSGDLISSVLDGGANPNWGVITWDADVPLDTSLTVQVRSGDDPFNLGPFVTAPASGQDLGSLIDPAAPYLQYRLAFSSSDPDASPIVREISIQNAIVGDLDGDGDVDLSDLSALLANYGTSSGANPEDGDLDGDGDVDLSDLSALLANYGAGVG
jgi:hypothetical protein